MSKKLQKRFIKKADKVNNAAEGNFAMLDASGNLLDSGHNHNDYITVEVDPTVPSWAKQPVKPEYTYLEIKNTPDLATVAISGNYNDLSNTIIAGSGISISSANKISVVGKEDVDNKVSAFQSTTDNQHYPTEKLVKDNLDLKANSADLASVALSGSYNDLINKPNLSSVATSGSYVDLSNKPVLAKVSSTGEYSDLLNKPELANVAISGSYADLSNTPTLVKVSSTGEYSDLKNTPNLSSVAISGSYVDLSNKPVLAKVSSTGEYSDLLNTPNLSTVATSGSYTDLSNKPTLVKVSSTGEYSDLLNTPNLAAVATSGSYTDLKDKPVITTETVTTLSIDGSKESMYIELSADATISYSNPAGTSVRNISLVIKNKGTSEITISLPTSVHRMMENIKIAAGKYGEIISTYSSVYGWVVNGGAEI